LQPSGAHGVTRPTSAIVPQWHGSKKGNWQITS
jgi:hypothetical protein